MNKEVIYLEPEDDITDVLTKLQKAEQRIVALVPPQKAVIFRSAVNMKLIARTAKEAEKAVVIVTVDPAVVRLAMATKLPVAKNLQSRPQIPTQETVAAARNAESVIDDDIEDVVSANNVVKKASEDEKEALETVENARKASKTASERRNGKSANAIELDDEEVLEGPKKGKNKDDKAKKAPKIDKTRKIIIASVLGALVAIVVLVWAFVFAPAATIAVSINTTPSNFAEGISFTSNASDENAKEGVFYAVEVTETSTFSVDIETTGEKDNGERAAGEVTLEVQFSPQTYEGGGFSLDISSGATVSTTGGQQYILQDNATFYWNGSSTSLSSVCANSSHLTTCVVRTTVAARAAEAGDLYNIAASSTWNSINANGIMVGVTNSKAFTGGTTDIVRIVAQKDVDDARDKVMNESAENLKKRFEESLKEKDVVVIDTTLKVEVKEVNSNPSVDAEATNATVTISVEASALTIDKTKVSEYINEKVSLAEDQKIYSIGEPYIERYTSLEESARLKAVIESGPTVTEESILEKARGRKIGEVASLLRSINGVNTVDIQGSYFWVGSVPDDPNKITITINVKENE